MNYFDGLRWSQKTNPEKLLKHFVQDWKHTKAGEAGILKKISEFLFELFLDIYDSVNALNDLNIFF